jgi:hypothetical protein
MKMATAFGVFASQYYWIGKMSGRQYSNGPATALWATFISANLIYFPMRTPDALCFCCSSPRTHARRLSHVLLVVSLPSRQKHTPDLVNRFARVQTFGAHICVVRIVRHRRSLNGSSTMSSRWPVASSRESTQRLCPSMRLTGLPVRSSSFLHLADMLDIRCCLRAPMESGGPPSLHGRPHVPEKRSMFSRTRPTLL